MPGADRVSFCAAAGQTVGLLAGSGSAVMTVGNEHTVRRSVLLGDSFMDLYGRAFWLPKTASVDRCHASSWQTVASSRLVWWLVLSAAVLLTAAGSASSAEEEAVLVLTQDTVSLTGSWELYWKQLLEPSELNAGEHTPSALVRVPGAWNGYKEIEGITGQGYATYRRTFRVHDHTGVIGLHVPRVFTSYRLWVNGEEAAGAGQVGTDRDSTRPQYLPQTFFFTAPEGTVELVIQVSNFHHRSGGLLRGLTMGTPGTLQAERQGKLSYDLFVFGSLLIMGIYHLVMFSFRRDEPSVLFFGIFCLLVALRTIMVGEHYLVQQFPDLNWEWAHKLQTMSYYAGLGTMILFFRMTFPRQISKRFVIGCILVTIAASAVVLVLPARYFTVINPAFQLFTVLVIFYMIAALLRVVRERETGALFIAAGAAVLFLSVLHDMVFLSVLSSDYGWLADTIRWGNLSSLGLLVFVLGHALVLAENSAMVNRRSDELSRQLLAMNETLESTVEERTAALAASKNRIEEQKQQLERNNQILETLSLQDPLTGLWNRRHFDEVLEKEWRRCRREGAELAVLFLDIDDFKQFNDRFGHQMGDVCLQQTADILRRGFQRSQDVVARYGGEEFVVLLPHFGLEQAAERARWVVQEVSGMRIPNACPVTVSVGAAAARPDGQRDSLDLVKAADQALYEAKSRGKNCVETVQLSADTPVR